MTKSIEWFNNKKRQKANEEIARKLQSKFHDLQELIKELIDNKWVEVDDQATRYFKIHLWFRANRPRYLSLWSSFNRNRIEPNNPINLSRNDLEYEVFYTNHQDPFSVFYEPMRLAMLKPVFRQWNNNDIFYVLDKLLELTIEFRTWLHIR